MAIGEGPSSLLPNPDAAGIDVGARIHYVAVPEGRLRCRFAALALTLPSSMS